MKPAMVAEHVRHTNESLLQFETELVALRIQLSKLETLASTSAGRLLNLNDDLRALLQKADQVTGRFTAADVVEILKVALENKQGRK